MQASSRTAYGLSVLPTEHETHYRANLSSIKNGRSLVATWLKGHCVVSVRSGETLACNQETEISSCRISHISVLWERVVWSQYAVWPRFQICPLITSTTIFCQCFFLKTVSGFVVLLLKRKLIIWFKLWFLGLNWNYLVYPVINSCELWLIRVNCDYLRCWKHKSRKGAKKPSDLDVSF